MPKFTCTERILVKSIVASLSIKRIPEQDIIEKYFDRQKRHLLNQECSTLERISKKNLINGIKLCVKVNMNTYMNLENVLMKS